MEIEGVTHNFCELVRVVLNSFGGYGGVRLGKTAIDTCSASFIKQTAGLDRWARET